MEIVIKGTSEEITDLASFLQGQLEKQIVLEQDVKELQRYVLAAREDYMKGIQEKLAFN